MRHLCMPQVRISKFNRNLVSLKKGQIKTTAPFISIEKSCQKNLFRCDYVKTAVFYRPPET